MPTFVRNATEKLKGDYDGTRVNKETLSPLDTTCYCGSALPGEHTRALERVTARVAHHREQDKQLFLRKGSSYSRSYKHALQAVVFGKREEAMIAPLVSGPPHAGSTTRRANPPNTELRRYYERSDLPIIIQQGARNKLVWKSDIALLDLRFYLPLWATGLREVEEPYR